MPETLKTEIGFTELATFLETKMKEVAIRDKQITNETEIVEVSIDLIMESLMAVESEIESNHRTAIKAWRQSHKIYAEFIRKNPGSQMLQRPQDMPKKPTQLQDIKSNVRMFKTFTAKTLKVKINFLKEIFNLSSQALTSSYTTRDYWVGATTGSMMTANYCLTSNNTSTSALLL